MFARTELVLFPSLSFAPSFIIHNVLYQPYHRPKHFTTSFFLWRARFLHSFISPGLYPTMGRVSHARLSLQQVCISCSFDLLPVVFSLRYHRFVYSVVSTIVLFVVVQPPNPHHLLAVRHNTSYIVSIIISRVLHVHTPQPPATMNKLKKSPPASSRISSFNANSSSTTSRTLQLARDMSISLGTGSMPGPPSRTKQELLRTPLHHDSAGAALAPLSPTAQYWAARAISAETLLAVREAHQRELRELLDGEENKRSVSFARVNSRLFFSQVF